MRFLCPAMYGDGEESARDVACRRSRRSSGCRHPSGPQSPLFFAHLHFTVSHSERMSLHPSTLCEYTPTSSSSLEQHTHLRILWLPLSVCFLWSGKSLQGSVEVSSAASAGSSSPSPSNVFSPTTTMRAPAAPLKASIRQGSFFRDSNAETLVGADGTVSGYELALRESLALHPPLPVATLNWRAFPGAPLAVPTPPKSSGEPKRNGTGPALWTPSSELLFLITSDLGTSNWENMDTHRSSVAVIVVVNAAMLAVPLEHAVQVVGVIFAAQFKDKVCRCIVVDPPTALAVELTKISFCVIVSASVPVKQTARSLLLHVAQAVVDAQGSALERYSHPDKVDSVAVRTPLDKPSGSASTRTTAAMMTSRCRKKSGDTLLLFGAPMAAVAAYGETQFNSNTDCLWCSATMESIAAARYRHLQTTLFCHRKSIDETVVQLQSDSPTWGPALNRSVQELGVWMADYGESLANTLTCFHSASVPHSMRTRLTREVEENVAAQVTLLKGLLRRARTCLEAGTWEIPADPQSYRLGSDVKRCVENVLRLAFIEIDIYLRESLRQLGKCTPAGALLSSSTISSTVSSVLGGVGLSGGPTLNATAALFRNRELETRFKRLELMAVREARQPFLEELSSLRSLFPGGYGTEWTERCLPFFAYLCMRNGTERRARAVLVEFAAIKARVAHVEEAAEVLLRVSSLPEFGLPFAATQASNVATAGWRSGRSLACWSDVVLHLGRTMITARTAQGQSGNAIVKGNVLDPSLGESINGFPAVEEQAPDRGTTRLNQSINNAASLGVPLLLELINLFDRMAPVTATAALRCQVAALLLFKYPHILDRPTQRLCRSVLSDASALLEPQVRTATVSPPFFLAWEALPLPPHLAPKTVPVGGALFTFIDTQRLKLTVLCLNGKKLNSRTVWTVGDVTSVLLTLYNPFEDLLVLDALALRCRSSASHLSSPEEGETDGDVSDGQVANYSEPLDATPSPHALKAPISYALSRVEVTPLSRRKVLLQVQPTEEGSIVIDGVVFRLAETHSPQPMIGKLPTPMRIPVLQRLPQVSCTLNTNELEIFGSQGIDFTVRVVNCGRVPISCISLTAHSEQCQLEGCEGCKERRADTDTTVTLNKRALDAASRTPLQPGDVVIIPGVLKAPPTISKFGAHFVVFRTDLSLPHAAPKKPPNLPDAVPVFAVIPRRVTETRLRLFHSPGLVVTSIALTKDRRAAEVRIANRSRLYSMELQLSILTFAELPDAFIVSGAEYVVPPIKLTRIPPCKNDESLRFRVPWVVRELPQCTGTLELNLALVTAEVVSTEPLDECVLTLDVGVSHTVLAPPPFDGSAVTSPLDCNFDGDAAGRSQKFFSRHGTVRMYRWESGLDSFNGCDGAGAVTHFGATSWSAGWVSTSPSGPPPDAAGTCNATLAHGAGHNSDICRISAEEVDVPALGSVTSWRGLKPSDPRERHSSGVPASIIVPAVTPIRLCLRVAAPRWRRAILLHVHVSIDSHFDVAVLTGAVRADAMVGEEGKAVYVREFELFAFKTGDHLLHVTISDDAKRELTHTIHLVVEHSRVL